MTQPSKKQQRTHPRYELLYHPGTPGRGEFVRLAFEAAGVSYVDVANDEKSGYGTVQKICMCNRRFLASSMRESAIAVVIDVADGPWQADADNWSTKPVFSPPALRIPGEGVDGRALVISQTPNILLYLGERLGLVPEDEAGRIWVNQITLTALDLNNEVHDTHHPVAVMKYYEDQKAEALAKATDVRESRFPKYFSYFERTLKWNAEAGKCRYLVGDKLTYADLAVWQVLDGSFYAFPKEMKARKEEFPELLGTFYDGVKEAAGVKEYLKSERRKPYSMGIFRHYPELDRQ